jgi:surface antigen
MRKSAFMAGLVLCSLISVAAKSSVRAEAAPPIILASSASVADQQKMLKAVTALSETQAKLHEKTRPMEHVVAAGESLSSIATQHQTTWERLYTKNTNIDNPDVIDVGQKIAIPGADEQLAARAAPVEVFAPTEPVQRTPRSAPRAQTARPVANRGSSAGNAYSVGYCTWYAKNRRPDLPNSLGNAATWVSRAAAHGIPTGLTPRAGAIGQRGNHVVYVESVNADGSVNVSEMNHKDWNVVSSRTVPASYFTYIH